MLHWGDQAPASLPSRGLPSGGTSHGGTSHGGTSHGGTSHTGTSHAGTIWAERATVRARTALTQVDPVYLAEESGAVVVSDRASWAAAVTGWLRDPDPVMTGAFLSLGYPLGGSTSFRGVRALGGDRAPRAAGGRLAVTVVRPLSEAVAPVQLSLTGGKDSRLVAAALAAAGVLATLAALLSGDWLSAREPAARTTAAAPDPGHS